MSKEKRDLGSKIGYMADCENVVEARFGDSTIEIKHMISLEETISFVSNAVSMCYSDDGVYMPELRDLAIRGNIIARYTNVKMPKDRSLLYYLVYNEELFGAVMSNVNDAQIKSIVYGIDRRIDLINRTGVASVNRDIDNVYLKMNEFVEKISALFSGVTKEELTAISNSVINGTIDEKKLVSEMHKLNVGEQNG